MSPSKAYRGVDPRTDGHRQIATLGKENRHVRHPHQHKDTAEASTGDASFPQHQSTMFVMRRTYQRRPLVVILFCSLLICILWVFSGQERPVWRPTADPQTYYSRRVAKATMLYGKPNPLYERAIDSHSRHARRWGYPMHILRQDISVGFWNKPSYLVSLVIQELAKPPSERVEWLM